MPTIISDEHRFIFAHVPKCGGSTIGPQLAAQLACDPYFLQTKFIPHPELGTIMPSHIPLWAVRDHFPEVFDRYRSYDGFAICREPRARFLSALAQHARELRKVDISRVDRPTVQAIVDDVRAAFEGDRRALLHHYVHFIPQSDFVALEGEQMVRNVFRIEALPQLAQALAARTGATIDGFERHNRTNHYRSEFLKSAIARLKPHAERLLPTGLFRLTRSVVLAAATVDTPEQVSAVLASPSVNDFVTEIYSADEALYARAAALPGPASAAA